VRRCFALGTACHGRSGDTPDTAMPSRRTFDDGVLRRVGARLGASADAHRKLHEFLGLARGLYSLGRMPVGLHNEGVKLSRRFELAYPRPEM